MKVNAMYMPNERRSLLRGFVVIKNNDNSFTVAVVDPEMNGNLCESIIKDVQRAKLSFNSPMKNDRFISCLAYAKQTISDTEWDAMRTEIVQRHKLGSLIPDSKFFKQ